MLKGSKNTENIRTGVCFGQKLSVTIYLTGGVTTLLGTLPADSTLGVEAETCRYLNKFVAGKNLSLKLKVKSFKFATT